MDNQKLVNLGTTIQSDRILDSKDSKVELSQDCGRSTFCNDSFETIGRKSERILREVVQRQCFDVLITNRRGLRASYASVFWMTSNGSTASNCAIDHFFELLHLAYLRDSPNLASIANLVLTSRRLARFLFLVLAEVLKGFC